MIIPLIFLIWNGTKNIILCTEWWDLVVHFKIIIIVTNVFGNWCLWSLLGGGGLGPENWFNTASIYLVPVPSQESEQLSIYVTVCKEYWIFLVLQFFDWILALFRQSVIFIIFHFTLAIFQLYNVTCHTTKLIWEKSLNEYTL